MAKIKEEELNQVNAAVKREVTRWRESVKTFREWQAECDKIFNETPDGMGEAIALSSPSGRMSKRARAAADKRWDDKYGLHLPPEPAQYSQPSLSYRMLVDYLSRLYADKKRKPKKLQIAEIMLEYALELEAKEA